MNAGLRDRKWPWLVLLAAVGASGQAQAQQRFRRVEEPRWLKLRLTEVSTGVYAESTMEQTTFKKAGTSFGHDRLFVGPSLGLGVEGSVYHPYLFRYLIHTEGAFGLGQQTLASATTFERNEFQYLGRFLGSADILANKPYHANLFATYDHTFRDYDFFSRATVDSWRYGTRLGYHDGPWTFGAGYARRDEDVASLSVASRSQEDTASFEAQHERPRGGTSFNSTLNFYSRADFDRMTAGRDYNFSLADNERFGQRERFRLNSNASLSHRETPEETSDQLTVGANLAAEHRHNLSSFYDLTYDRYATENFSSANTLGRAELRHQLYESLTSTLTLQAADYEASDRAGSGFTRRFGLGFGENYTKRLGANHRLRISNSLFGEHVDRQSISTVENERHNFTDRLGGAPPDSFFLNLPNVNEATIVVTDDSDRQPAYLRGLDYDVTRNGVSTLIRRLSGSRIPAGATVLVDYEAEPSASGSYEALSETFQVRFDLWNNLWGLYGRVNLFVNNAPRELLAQNLRSYTFGTDLTWRWLNAGAEYEIYDSDQSRYRAARLFQSFSFSPDPVSSLSLSFSQSWTDYTDAHRQEQDFRFITRYRRAVSGSLALDLEGGVAIRQGPGVDRTLATVRPGLEYSVGKTSLKVGYEFEHEIFLDTEERTKHMFFIRARRVF
jgi:hypothetical protein